VSDVVRRDCSWCGWDGPGYLHGLHDEDLRHSQSIGARCTRTYADLCGSCAPYATWREGKLKPMRRERYRCPDCYPMSAEELAAVKLERESARPFVVGIDPAAGPDAQGEIIRAFIGKHRGAAAAHRVMILDEPAKVRLRP
jgi:hypothetical protein